MAWPPCDRLTVPTWDGMHWQISARTIFFEFINHIILSIYLVLTNEYFQKLSVVHSPTYQDLQWNEYQRYHIIIP